MLYNKIHNHCLMEYKLDYKLFVTDYAIFYISFCLDFEIGYPRFLDNDR